MKSKFVKTMLFAFLTIGLAVSCAPKGSGGNPGGGGGEGGDSGEGGGQGGDDKITTFPADEVKAFFAAANIDIGNLPYFDIDDSDPEYFDIYPTNTTSAELVAYKNALKTAGWAVISPDEDEAEDFILKYGETDAYVSLLDYTSFVGEDEDPYNLVSFYVYEESYDSYYVDKVVADYNANLEAAGETMRVSYNSYYESYISGKNFDGSDESEATLKAAAEGLAQYLPDYMTVLASVYGDPTDPDYEDVFSDQSYYYFIGAMTPDFGVAAMIYSYLGSSGVFAHIIFEGEEAPLEFASVKDAIEYFAKYKGENDFVAPDFGATLDAAATYSVTLNDGYYADSLDIKFEGDVTSDVLAVLSAAEWDVPTTQTSYGYECFYEELFELDVLYYADDAATYLSLYYYDDLYGGGGGSSEVDPLNETLAQFLDDANIDATLPDLSAFNQYVDSYDLDPTNEQGYGVSAYVYFDSNADIFEDLCLVFAEWDYEEGLFGYDFTNPEKTVTVSVNDFLGVYLVVKPYEEPEPSEPADWGDFESLTGFISAFLAARGVEGHTVPDLSDYQDSVVEYYGTSFSKSGISLWVDGDVVDGVLNVLDTLGYDVPEEPAESGAYELLSDDELVFIQVGYASYYKQTVIYIYAYADVYEPPFEPGDPGYVADAIEEFASNKGIEGFEAPDFTSVEDKVTKLTATYDDGQVYDNLEIQFEGDMVNDILAIFDGAGWDVPETAGDYGYECISANNELEADVKLSSDGSYTRVTFYSYDDLYGGSDFDLDAGIAGFFADNGVDPDFPSLASLSASLYNAGKYTDDEYDVYFYGDLMDAVEALFDESWTLVSDDYGDTLTSADETIEVDIYYSYGYTIVEIYVLDEVPTIEPGEWPAEAIAAYMEEYGFEGTVPAYSGDFEEVEVDPYQSSIVIIIDLGSNNYEDAEAAYIASLGDNFEKVDEGVYSDGKITLEITSYGYQEYNFLQIEVSANAAEE